MPKTKISEVDKTQSPLEEAQDYVLLMPGFANNSVDGLDDDNLLFSSKEKFIDVIGEPSDSDKKMAFKMACYLLDLGLKVQYAVIEDTTELDNYGFWKKYEDKNKYNIRFVCSGDYRTISVAENMVTLASTRGDAIALVDIPNGDDSESGGEFDANFALAWIKNLRTISVAGDDPSNGYKYAAAFSQDILFNGEMDSLFTFPGSFSYLSAFAEHARRFPDWFAMAGSVRGVLPYTGVVTNYSFSKEELDKLQDRTTANHQSINPIANIKPYGNIIWGNRTLFPNPTGSDLVASSFLNIRNLCCDIKKALYKAADKYRFEPNSDVLWTNFKSEVIPLLERMKSGQGIKGYKIAKVVNAPKATLKAVVTIIPIEAVEDFDLTVVLSDSISVTE